MSLFGKKKNKKSVGLDLKKKLEKKEESSTPAKTATIPVHKGKKEGESYKILLKPLMTEKGTAMQINRQYIFQVAMHTNKPEVKKAIEDIYGVKPEKVRMIRLSGKKVRYGRTQGKTKNWKKAIITLKLGDKIEVWEGV